MSHPAPDSNLRIGTASYSSSQGITLTISIGAPEDIQDPSGRPRQAYPIRIKQSGSIQTEWDQFLDGSGQVVRSELRCTTYTGAGICLELRRDWHRLAPPMFGLALPNYVHEGQLDIRSDDAATKLLTPTRRASGTVIYDVPDLPAEFRLGRNSIEGGQYEFAASNQFPIRMTLRNWNGEVFTRTAFELGAVLPPIPDWPQHEQPRPLEPPLLFTGESAPLAANGPTPLHLIERARQANPDLDDVAARGCVIGFGYDPSAPLPNRNGSEILLPEAYRFSMDTLSDKDLQERWEIEWTENGLGPDKYIVQSRAPIQLGDPFNCRDVRNSPRGGIDLSKFTLLAQRTFGPNNVFRIEAYMAGQRDLSIANQYGTMLFYGAYAEGGQGTGLRLFLQPVECKFRAAYLNPDTADFTIPTDFC